MKPVHVALVTLGTLPGLVLAQESVSFPVGQAAAGRMMYEQHCAECHLETMLGSFEAPELAGPNFLSYWGGRSVGELFSVATTMPPDDEDSLGDDVYAGVVAYILERNGFPAGARPLTVAEEGALDGALMAGQGQAAAGGVASNHDITGILALGQQVFVGFHHPVHGCRKRVLGREWIKGQIDFAM